MNLIYDILSRSIAELVRRRGFDEVLECAIDELSEKKEELESLAQELEAIPSNINPLSFINGKAAGIQIALDILRWAKEEIAIKRRKKAELSKDEDIYARFKDSSYELPDEDDLDDDDDEDESDEDKVGGTD